MHRAAQHAYSQRMHPSLHLTLALDEVLQVLEDFVQHDARLSPDETGDTYQLRRLINKVIALKTLSACVRMEWRYLP